MKTYHNHLVSNIPNNFLTRFLVGRVVRLMTKSKSGHTLLIRYRKPKKGQKYGWCGNLRRDNARRFSIYLTDKPQYKKYLREQEEKRKKSYMKMVPLESLERG